MKKIRHNLYLFLFILTCAAGLSCTASAATPYAENGALSVKSGKIVNSSGNTFVIKGVSTHGIAWYPEYINKAAFQDLRDNWGVNTIRLALYSADYNGYCTGGDTSQLKTYIDNGVTYATELGMYVIIDWHILSDGNPLTYKKQANAFFKYAANKYKDYGNVLYEICNEPNGSGGTWKNIKSYAKTIIKTIRTYDADAIIAVGTPTWSQDVDTAMADPITGYSNLVYSFHFYAGTHQESMRSKLEAVLKNNFPVLVTEFGISDASGGGSANTSQGDQWISLLDTYGVGRVCWSLSNKNETCSFFKSSCSKTSGWANSDLTASGKWLVKTYTGSSLSGSSSSGSSSSSTKNTSSSSSTTASASKNTGKSASSKGKVKLKATVKCVNTWKSGGYYYAQYTLTIKNTKARASKNWKVKIKFSQNVSISSKWSAKYSKKKKTLTVKPLSWNKKLKKGSSTQVGFILKSSKKQSVKSISITAS